MLNKVVISLTLFISLSFTVNSEAQTNKNVLIFNSYHKGYKWSDDITRGIEVTLKNSTQNPHIFTEYMGTKQLSDEKYFRQLVDIYLRKYKTEKIDLIITEDDNAFNFIKKYGKDLFPNIPIIFCGVNYYVPDEKNPLKNFTGVSEEVDIKSTIDLALTINPSAKKIYVIVDNTTTGQKIQNNVKSIISDYNNYQFEFLSDFSMEELKDTVSRINHEKIILYAFFFRDKNNIFYEYDESIKRISESSLIPIYGAWDFSLGNGIIGGKLTSGYYQGETAGKLALRVLDGESISNIPIVLKSPNKYLFDYQLLKKFNIPIDILPSDSEYINEPKSFYAQNRELVWAIIAIFFSLIVFIVFLGISLQRKRKMTILMSNLNKDLEDKIAIRTKEISEINNKLLQELKEKERVELELRNRRDLLDNVLSTIPDYVYWKDNHLIYQGCNKSFAKLLGLENPHEIISKTNSDFLNHIEFLDKLSVSDDSVLSQKNGNATVEEFEETIDNKLRYFLVNKVPLIDINNVNYGVLCIFSDVTEKKIAQQEKDLMEIELRQSQKMDSIGQLAAGIAHEMNTPIQFISDNTHFIQTSFADLLSVLNKSIALINSNEKESTIQSKIAELNCEIDNIGLDFILEEIPKAVDQSLKGLKRVSNIVHAMKEFSHKGTQQKDYIDLNKAVENTLIVSKNEWKYIADIETELDSSLPHIECLASQINQVFLNIIVNASHSIEEKGLEKKGKIQISTKQCAEEVAIIISDNGKGIPDEIKTKIFDPFFTTKEVGKGTGQGLSIAYDIIVNKHRGSISFVSERGKGTTFTIKLPVK